MVRACRVVHARYAADPVSGQGAKRFGGRWNSPGVAAVYASQNLSLAVLELLANLQDPAVLEEYRMLDISFLESAVEAVEIAKLPAGWRGPPMVSGTRAIGDEWLASLRSLVLAVPSAVLSTELNYVLNPAHPDFAAVECSEALRLPIDARLLAVRIMERP
jgi:RES domain-containing protein